MSSLKKPRDCHSRPELSIVITTNDHSQSSEYTESSPQSTQNGLALETGMQLRDTQTARSLNAQARSDKDSHKKKSSMINPPIPETRVTPRHSSYDGALGKDHKYRERSKKASDNLGS